MSFVSIKVRRIMIVHVSGKLISKDTSHVIVDVNGIGYNIYITLNTYNTLPNLNSNIFLLTYYNISDKGHDLFGFSDIGEKQIFEMLISISGIGPKIAINLLSFVTPTEFKERLISGEVKMLSSLPGIGPKTAKRIIVELKDKFITSDSNDLPIDDENEIDSDVFNALKNLGYKSKDIRFVLNKIGNEGNIENKIKQALKELR